MDIDQTKKSYEDPQIVAGYIENNAINPKMTDKIIEFSEDIHGTKVIDIGCGPGHDSYIFSELGFDVIGIDYSSEMIKAAKNLKNVRNSPIFKIMDMRDIAKNFQEGSFDAAWVCASLLHIRERDVPKVLEGLKKIVKNGGIIFIGLKEGKQKEERITEEKYGKKMVRKFVLWKKESFDTLLEDFGFETFKFNKQLVKSKSGGTTSWLNYTIKVVKE
jgi:SAM-dependent methyltransferase